MSLARPVAALLHASAVSVMTYGYLNLENTVMNTWIQDQKGGHFQFLTIQGLSLAWLVMSAGLIIDLFPSLPYLKSAKRYLLMIALPLAVVISSIYWPLILFLPNLIVQFDPNSSAPLTSEPPNLYMIPLKLDLALHAAPALSLLIDFFLFETKYTDFECRYAVPVGATLFSVWYSCWVEYCASFNGTFPYPFLTNNPLPIRIAIYLSSTIFAVISFRTFNALRREDSPSHATPNGSSLRAKKKSKNM